jgi:hypothetical protein
MPGWFRNHKARRQEAERKLRALQCAVSFALTMPVGSREFLRAYMLGEDMSRWPEWLAFIACDPLPTFDAPFGEEAT